MPSGLKLKLAETGTRWRYLPILIFVNMSSAITRMYWRISGSKWNSQKLLLIAKSLILNPMNAFQNHLPCYYQRNEGISVFIVLPVLIVRGLSLYWIQGNILLYNVVRTEHKNNITKWINQTDYDYVKTSSSHESPLFWINQPLQSSQFLTTAMRCSILTWRRSFPQIYPQNL